MQVIHAQNQGIINGLKNSAVIRFLAKMGRSVKDEDIEKNRAKFTADNLKAENHGGIMVYDAKFEDVKPIESKPFNVLPAQMKQIQENVFNYFGMNEAILQNKYTEDEWNAYFEGKIEPFAVQLSLAMSNMTYTTREISHGNKIIFTTNRLQYASNKTKLFISTQLIDRGILNRNEVREIWNRPPIEEGDLYFIRREYGTISQVSDGETDEPQKKERDSDGDK
jgi:hypothetical protein